jgi:hypothetical protein
MSSSLLREIVLEAATLQDMLTMLNRWGRERRTRVVDLDPAAAGDIAGEANSGHVEAAARRQAGRA